MIKLAGSRLAVLKTNKDLGGKLLFLPLKLLDIEYYIALKNFDNRTKIAISLFPSFSDSNGF